MTAANPTPGTLDGFGRGGADSRRVVMAFHDPLLNGATISALRAVPLLEEMGWRFAFWSPAPGPCFDWLLERGAEVSGQFRPIASGLRALAEPPGVAKRLFATPGYLANYRRFIQSIDPSLVHANSLYSFAEALAARAMRYPALLHVHDMAPRGKPRAVRAICRRGVTKCVAVSRACAKSYAHDGWSPELVYEATPIPSHPASARAAPSPFVVGTIGVVARRKGSDLFVAAARDLVERYPGRFEFRMIGSPDDPLERSWGEEVIRQAKNVGIQHACRATDVFEELRGWDAFVLPSRMDPCPIVMLEAMATGLPVIGALTDGIPEQVTPETGLLVPGEDSVALAGAIEEISSWSLERRQAAGAAGRTRVASTFSLDRQAESLATLYRACLA